MRRFERSFRRFIDRNWLYILIGLWLTSKAIRIWWTQAALPLRRLKPRTLLHRRLEHSAKKAIGGGDRQWHEQMKLDA